MGELALIRQFLFSTLFSSFPVICRRWRALGCRGILNWIPEKLLKSNGQ